MDSGWASTPSMPAPATRTSPPPSDCGESCKCTGSGLATEHRIRRISSATSNGGTAVGPNGPVGLPPAPLFWADQDEMPAVPGGGEKRSAGRNRQWFQQLGHGPYRGHPFRLSFPPCALRSNLDIGPACSGPEVKYISPNRASQPDCRTRLLSPSIITTGESCRNLSKAVARWPI